MFIPYKFLVNRFVAFSFRNFHNKFGGRHELKTPAVRTKIRKKAESRNSKEIRFDTPLSTVARNASVQVLSTGAYGMGRSVVLRTGNQMYLFNCGEGTQKILTDNGITLSQVDDFFITFNSWDNTGGIFAFFIHSSMSTNPSKEVLRCHGPSFVEKVKAMLVIASDKKRNFFPTCEQRGIKDVKFKDDQLTVEYVELLHAASDGKTPQLYDSWAFKKKVFNEIEGSNGIYETALNGKKTVMCYIIKLANLSTNVDISKMLKLNISSGPWIKQLVSGKSVTLEDGRVIHPKDVMTNYKTAAGPIVVLDCPTEDYLESLITNKQLLDLQTDNVKPVLMIHMAPAALIADPRYQAFMDRFQSETTHLMMNEDSPGPYIHKSQMFQSVLNRLHAQISPVLQGKYNYNMRPTPTTGRIVQACPGLKYTIRPEKDEGFNWDSLPYYDAEEYFHNVKEEAVNESLEVIKYLDYEKHSINLKHMTVSDVENEINLLKKKLNAREALTEDKDYPEVVFLGTGSGKPSSFRNSSSILLQIRKDEYFLMDCGEGTLLQMYQMYGLEKTQHILRNLKGVFITHLHFDHHGGLFSIIEVVNNEMRQKRRMDKLTIIAPITFSSLCQHHSRYLNPIENSYKFIPNHALYDDVKTNPNSYVLREVKNLLGLSELAIVPVYHSVKAYGICMRHKDGWKLVYSGDTEPCDLLIRYGQNCDILIHEATLDGGKEESAARKRHSTVTSAIQVGRDMNAKFIILTHFSQKYAKLPVFPEESTKNVAYAFDFMQLRPSQLWTLHLVKPALNALFGGQRDSKFFRVLLQAKRDERWMGKKAVNVEELAD